jgi:hypothetical protein
LKPSFADIQINGSGFINVGRQGLISLGREKTSHRLLLSEATGSAGENLKGSTVTASVLFWS